MMLSKLEVMILKQLDNLKICSDIISDIIPDSSTILRLSKIFDVSIDEIIYGEFKTKEKKRS